MRLERSFIDNEDYMYGWINWLTNGPEMFVAVNTDKSNHPRLEVRVI